MIEYLLRERWFFRQTGRDEWLTSEVPGGVHTALIAQGRIPDPFVGVNERDVQWVAEQDWEYRCLFTPDPALSGQDCCYLLCEGLDTLAELRLNGQIIGRAANMFTPYRWDVTGALLPGENELLIRFASPVRYTAQKQAARPMFTVNDVLPGAPYLRKAPSHYGWDWGPKLANTGPWRDILLVGYRTARLADVHLRQRHTGRRVTLTSSVRIEAWKEAGLLARMLVSGPDGATWQTDNYISGERTELAVQVEQPQYWWPNGYGDQPLYQVEITLFDGEIPLEQKVYRIGLRTIELHQADDEWGRSFTFIVNGVPVFAKGANWIPADSFPARVDARHYESLVRSAAQANMNMLRVWGGGYYERETFYDLCDRFGLLVWQDFMFACSTYPLDEPEFLENIRGEVQSNVRRIRHHACLALWCGNNEMESGWEQWGWDRPDVQDLKSADARFFYQTLPEWVKSDDPDTAYWPGSPSSHLPHQAPNSDAAGDNHLWEVWHASQPFKYYRTRYPRFASEFGLQSFPVVDTLLTFARPQDLNLTSEVMEHHQRSPIGNEKILFYLAEHFRLPGKFSDLVYLSQINQAEAMRTGVEHWRRNRARCSGALYWQLNDCWPVASWSSMDYFGRWKVLQYAARRFFAPVLLSVEDTPHQIIVHVTNDLPILYGGEISWSFETLDGQAIKNNRQVLEAPPLDDLVLATLAFDGPLADIDRREVVFVCELWQGDERLALQVIALAPSKHLRLQDPAFQVQVHQEGHQLQVSLQSTSLARYVQVALEGQAELIWSDNYFDLPAHRIATISCLMPEGWTLEQAHQALRIKSLYDTLR